MGRRVVLPLILALASAGLVACNGSDGQEADPTESLPWQTESTETEEAESTPDEEALAAVEAYWQAFDEAAQIPDPDHGGLEDVASGQALQEAQDVAQTMIDQGRRQEGSTVLSDLAVLERTPEDDPTTVLVELCMDTTPTLIVDADTGQPIQDEEYGRRDSRAQVIATTDGWTVDVVNVKEIGSC